MIVYAFKISAVGLFKTPPVCLPAGDSEDNTVPLYELARSRRPLIVRLHTGYDRTNERVPRERWCAYMCALQVGRYYTSPVTKATLKIKKEADHRWVNAEMEERRCWDEVVGGFLWGGSENVKSGGQTCMCVFWNQVSTQWRNAAAGQMQISQRKLDYNFQTQLDA